MKSNLRLRYSVWAPLCRRWDPRPSCSASGQPPPTCPATPRCRESLRPNSLPADLQSPTGWSGLPSHLWIYTTPVDGDTLHKVSTNLKVQKSAFKRRSMWLLINSDSTITSHVCFPKINSVWEWSLSLHIRLQCFDSSLPHFTIIYESALRLSHNLKTH